MSEYGLQFCGLQLLGDGCHRAGGRAIRIAIVDGSIALAWCTWVEGIARSMRQRHLQICECFQAPVGAAQGNQYGGQKPLWHATSWLWPISVKR